MSSNVEANIEVLMKEFNYTRDQALAVILSPPNESRKREIDELFKAMKNERSLDTMMNEVAITHDEYDPATKSFNASAKRALRTTYIKELTNKQNNNQF